MNHEFLIFFHFPFSESVIILWNKKEGLDLPITPSEDIVNKEQWTSLKVLRGHVEDVYDLSWSPDSSSLVSASLDNSVILWNVQKGKKIALLQDYQRGFPQGVTWDPNNKFIATISSDRYLKSKSHKIRNFSILHILFLIFILEYAD